MTDNIPNYKDLKKRYSLNERISFLFLITTLVLDIFLIFYFFNETFIFKIFCSLSILVALYFIFKDYIGVFLRKKTPMGKVKSEKIGQYYTKDIKIMISKIFENYKNKELPEIYIIDEYDSAYVIDIYVFNFLKPINAIYLPIYYFNILKFDEIKAIIGHELGHFYKYILPLKRFIFPLNLFLCLIPVFSLYFMNIFKEYFLFIYLFLFIPYSFIIQKTITFQSKNAEYLSDYYSAKLFGKLNFINSLIVLSKHDEVLEYLQEKILVSIKNHNDISIKNFAFIFSQVINLTPYEVFSKYELDKIVNDFFKSAKVKKFRKKLSKLKVKQEIQCIDLILESLNSNDFKVDDDKIIDWSEFDFIKKNYRIEEDEYNYLIKSITKNLDKQLVGSLSDSDSKFNNLHPSLRKRILFLDKNISELNKVEMV